MLWTSGYGMYFYGDDDDDGLSYLWSSSFEFRSQKSLQSV